MWLFIIDVTSEKASVDPHTMERGSVLVPGSGNQGMLHGLFVIKKAIDYGTQAPLNLGLQFEHLGFAVNSQSKDLVEGISAFLQKREPKFSGE